MQKSTFLILFLVFTVSNTLAQQSKWVLPKVVEPKFTSERYTITNYGAEPDGHTLNTDATQNTIDECHAKGGGIVAVPAGLWLTGPIVLKSNVNLNLATGSTLLFTAYKSRYPLGADIGLHFKTTRGRGGIVENIFIRDIYMKDILGEAILFDMYYKARDPIPAAGEVRALPSVELKHVDETTPQFRNFHISNVFVNGAEKAIFMRGLPEMHVNDIRTENAVFQSKHGIDIQEASNIQLRNIKVFSSLINPVIDIINSKDIKHG